MEQSYSQFHTRPQSQIKQMDVLARRPQFGLSFWSIGHVQFFFLESIGELRLNILRRKKR